MRQKTIGIALLVTVALLVMATGVVFANGIYQGMMPNYLENNGITDEGGNWGPRHGFGWGFDSNDEFPSMRTFMIEAVAKATGLSADEIENQIAAGERLFVIALEAGMTEEAYYDLKTSVRQEFFAAAVEEGRISQEQYQWMFERWGDDWQGRGFGGCRYQEGEYSPMYNQQQYRGRRW